MWKDIPGHPGYRASEDGEIEGPGRHGQRRVLSHSVHSRGHHYVHLTDADGRRRAIQVHRLVLLAWKGPPPGDWRTGAGNGLHEDDNPHNNHISNLRWGSRTENSHDSVSNGNHTQARKTVCPLGHKLAEPNLVPSTSKFGFRGCLACKRTQSAQFNDTVKMPTRYNRGRDGFVRKAGETFKQEADRRYALIMEQGRS